MGMKNTLSTGLVIATVMLFYPAWGEAKTYTIGFSQPDANESDWRKANIDSFRDAAAELKVNVIFKDGAGKPELQKEHVKAFIDQKVNAIVLAAYDVNGWDDILLKAKQAKIPVVLEGRTISLLPENRNKGLYTTWVGSDFRFEGRLAAAWLAQETSGRCNIVEIKGPPDDGSSTGRAEGFRDLIKLFPSMKIIASQTGMWRAEQGKEVMKQLLNDEGANICAVFAHNDNMAFGAIEAIEENRELGLRPGKDILVIGVDGTRRGFELLIEKKMSALVECNPLLGKIVLKVVLQILSGRNVPPIMYMDDKVFTVHTAKAAFPSRKY
jgi:galactofuranose transport system substrate-binding protein